jgi:hypothetical protein
MKKAHKLIIVRFQRETNLRNFFSLPIHVNLYQKVPNLMKPHFILLKLKTTSKITIKLSLIITKSPLTLNYLLIINIIFASVEHSCLGSTRHLFTIFISNQIKAQHLHKSCLRCVEIIYTVNTRSIFHVKLSFFTVHLILYYGIYRKKTLVWHGKLTEYLR